MCPKQSAAFIKACLECWRPERIYVAFNGGKDATVVLELYSEALKHFHPGVLPRGVWFKENEFREVESFVDETLKLKQLDLSIYHGSYKEKLREFLRDVNSTAKDTVLVIVGYRAADEIDQNRRRCFKMFMPISSELCHEGFPGIRFNPIMSWTYGDVWEYITAKDLKVCPLYYRGYSSLGTVDRTVLNPALENGGIHPRELKFWSLERASRRTSGVHPQGGGETGRELREN